MSDEAAYFEGKPVQIVGKRRMYVKIKTDTHEKWVASKRVSEFIPESVCKEAVAGVQSEEAKSDDMSDSDSVISDSKLPDIKSRNSNLKEPNRRSVTFSPVVMTRDMNTFANVPVIRGTRSERSNSGLGSGWYTLGNMESIVRETAEAESGHLYTLNAGATVYISKIVGSLAQISSPCAGWIEVDASGMNPLSQESIDSLGLEQSVPSIVKRSSQMSARSSGGLSTDLAGDMSDWIADQLQKVEDEIYGKKEGDHVILPPVHDLRDANRSLLSVSRRRKGSLNEPPLSITDVPSVPIRGMQSFSEPTLPSVRYDDEPEEQPISTHEGDSQLRIQEDSECTMKSLGTVNDSVLRHSLTYPSRRSNLYEPDSLTNLTSSEKVLDPEPQILREPVENSESPNSLFLLLRQLSSTRKEIRRLQSLESNIVSQVIACFDLISSQDEEDEDLEFLLWQTLQKKKKKKFAKRFPDSSHLESHIANDVFNHDVSMNGFEKRSSGYNSSRHGPTSNWDRNEPDPHERIFKQHFGGSAPRSDTKQSKSIHTSGIEERPVKKEDLMQQGKDLIMKMAELMGHADGSLGKGNMKKLEKRSSDYNLFRHGSVSKWSESELERHERELRDQVASLANSDEPSKKQGSTGAETNIKTMITIRNSDINLFRPESVQKWSDSEMKRTVDSMQNEMEWMHENMIATAPVEPQIVAVSGSFVARSPEGMVQSPSSRHMESREATRSRCLSYDSSVLFSDSSDVDDMLIHSPSELSQISDPDEKRLVRQIGKTEIDETTSSETQCGSPPTP